MARRSHGCVPLVPSVIGKPLMSRRETPTTSATRVGALERAAALLLGAPFVLSVGLLLVNDAVLKPVLHDWLTGKLSDFAGLFVFPVLVVAVSGWRARTVCWATAVAFVVLKSPLATPLLVEWNAHAPWPVERAIDYSDWIALVAVVWAEAYVARRRLVGASRRSLRRAAAVTVGCLSLAVVAGDSIIRFAPIADETAFELPVTRAAIIDHLDAIGLSHTSVVFRRRNDRRPFPVDTLDVSQPRGGRILRVELAEAPQSRTIMRLIGASTFPVTVQRVGGPATPADSTWSDRARAQFEHDLAAPLQRYFDSRQSLVGGDVYHLRSINGRKPPVVAPDSECGGRITGAAVEVRYVDTLVVSIDREGATQGCAWRSYVRLVRRAGDSSSTFVDLGPGVDAGVLLGAWRLIAAGPELYLERVDGRPLLGVGTDLTFSR